MRSQDKPVMLMLMLMMNLMLSTNMDCFKPMDKTQLSSENGRKVLYFSPHCKFIARALLDSRIIDFNFNPVFCC